MMVIAKIKEKFAPLLIDRVVRWLALICVILNLITWIILLYRLLPLAISGQAVALHYNIYTNVNAVGSAFLAFAGAVTGSVILVVNLILTARFYGTSRQNALVVMIVTCLYELLTLAAAIFILLINISR